MKWQQNERHIDNHEDIEGNIIAKFGSVFRDTYWLQTIYIEKSYGEFKMWIE